MFHLNKIIVFSQKSSKEYCVIGTGTYFILMQTLFWVWSILLPQIRCKWQSWCVTVLFGMKQMLLHTIVEYLFLVWRKYQYQNLNFFLIQTNCSVLPMGFPCMFVFKLIP